MGEIVVRPVLAVYQLGFVYGLTGKRGSDDQEGKGIQLMAKTHPLILFIVSLEGKRIANGLVIFSLAELGEQETRRPSGQGILCIPEEHIRIILEIERVLDPGIPDRLAPLESHLVLWISKPSSPRCPGKFLPASAWTNS